jgi:uncharacterized membrane protein YhaH (DUF805 family)
LQKLLFSFDGRVNRAKWWGWSIVAVIAYGALVGISMAIFGSTMSPEGVPQPSGLAIVLCAVGFIAYFWVVLALAVKRWHDRNKSGWWIFISLVPVIGGLWYLIECGFLPGTSGPNKYGSDPLGAV